jgi:phosphate uptake regulator
MGRKLIQHGISSLTVSLPRKWVQKNNLKKGGEVEVSESGSRLIISAQKHHEHRKIDIDISDAKPMIRKIIGAAFKSGYDEVNIKFSSFDELKAVQDLMREQFSGFEIISQSKNNIVIKNISQTDFEEFSNVLRRLFFVLNQTASEISDAAEKDDFSWMKKITLMKIESDKYADYCRRSINMGFEAEHMRVSPLYVIIEQLEKTMDRYRDLCEYASSNKIKISSQTKSFLKELGNFQEDFYNLFYKFETGKMRDFGRKKEILQKKLEQIELQCPKKEIKIIALLDRILNLIFDLNGPLMATYM